MHQHYQVLGLFCVSNLCLYQWRMVVILTGCTLFLTSMCDVKFTFQNQRFGEVFWQCISLYTHCTYSLLCNLICLCIDFKPSAALQLKMQALNSLHSKLRPSNHNCKNIRLHVKTRVTRSLEIFQGHFFNEVRSVAWKGLVMPGTTAWLYAPLTNSSIEQRSGVWWSMYLDIRCLWRHFDVWRWFGEVCWHSVHIILHALSLPVIVAYNVSL